MGHKWSIVMPDNREKHVATKNAGDSNWVTNGVLLCLIIEKNMLQQRMQGTRHILSAWSQELNNN